MDGPGPFVPERNSGFLLFSPDAVGSGHQRFALLHLASLGIRAKGVAVVRPTPEQIAALYGKNRRGRPPEAEDLLVDRLFAAGPSLAYWLVFDGRPETPSMTDTLRVLKGPSDPAGCLPGHLRHILGAENRLMNGVHSSDSPEEASAELDALGVTEFGAVPAATDGAARNRPSSALSVACLVRRRVLDAVHVTAVPEVDALQVRAQELAALRTKSAVTLRALDELWERQHALVERARPRDWRAVTDCLAEVAEVCSKRFDPDALGAAVAPFGVRPTDWEDLVLRCQAATGVPAAWRALA
ncbi:nucleoside-diphosphate kinase [Streptomyces anulatus]|uniref:nucleoside-diphosphate kinase n=1 Tax=Streptomyces anulatus TaxID=1892 RepID=UPI001D190806|nr:nucleoside-diphosphate kinase [Streptomyces anulatus]